MGTGLLVTGVLATIALLPLERSVTAFLALLAVVALAVRTVLGLRDTRAALGPYAAAFDMVVELALALAAAWLTGGVRSPLLLVPGASLVLSRRFHGPAATRFLALATVLGLVVLAGTSTETVARTPLGLVLVLWPLAVLAAIEVALPVRPAPLVPGHRRDTPPRVDPIDLFEGNGPARRTAAGPEAAPRAPIPSRPVEDDPVPEPPREAPPGPPRERDLRAEILHDLRSPLSVVKVYSDLIAERARRGEPPVDEHLRNLAAEIELMELLVNGRDTGRERIPVRAGAVDLVRMLRELTDRYREAHGEKVRIELSAERSHAEVSADPVALQRVFRNVLDNALQYTPAGGTVRVRLWTDGAHAHVIVSDTGVGMTPEERERAFELSYRGRGAQALRAGGRGLGLTLSRELVEAMGGSISLWSEEDRGSEVRVLLPVAADVSP